jgi:hypothetical protein
MLVEDFFFCARGFEAIKQRKMRNPLLSKWCSRNVMVLAVVDTEAVRSFASATLICVWLDEVQVPGGQEKFSDGKGLGLMNC